jgi:DNA-binding NarL/FixJ family response regulator
LDETPVLGGQFEWIFQVDDYFIEYLTNLMILVALVDDHTITRRGIKSVLELHPEIQVSIEASNGRELLEKIKANPLPDIVILDINMPVMNGFQTIRHLTEKHANIKIIVFSLINEKETVLNMINSGASGYISKSADPDTLANAVLSVSTSGYYLSDLVKKAYFKNANLQKIKPGFNGSQYLTPKELEFIRLSATNLNYKEIASELAVSPKTLENYRDSLFSKLNINNRAALVLFGIKNGLISTSS